MQRLNNSELYVMSKVSIIIPVLNEVTLIERRLLSLQYLKKTGHEIIVVDGGSTDDTVSIAKKYSDRVIISDKGRAVQMNAGAEEASGDILIFLHVDTELSHEAIRQLLFAASNYEQFWGFFQIKLSGSKVIFRAIELFMNKRSRFSKIGTGDQTLFISRDIFNEVGGYNELSLMEDVAFCKILKRRCKPIILNAFVITSSRRWEANGVIYTIIQMWYLRLAFYLGMDTSLLAKKYYD